MRAAEHNPGNEKNVRIIDAEAHPGSSGLVPTLRPTNPLRSSTAPMGNSNLGEREKQDPPSRLDLGELMRSNTYSALYYPNKIDKKKAWRAFVLLTPTWIHNRLPWVGDTRERAA